MKKSGAIYVVQRITNDFYSHLYERIAVKIRHSYYVRYTSYLRSCSLKKDSQHVRCCVSPRATEAALGVVVQHQYAGELTRGPVLLEYLFLQCHRTAHAAVPSTAWWHPIDVHKRTSAADSRRNFHGRSSRGLEASSCVSSGCIPKHLRRAVGAFE